MAKYLFALFLVVLSLLPEVSDAKGILSMITVPKFDWLPTECAHRQFPMRLIHGDLILKDGSSLYVPAKAVIDNGWGELGSTHIVGKTMKALPVKLTVTWFSFAENKFFSGTFELPYNLILKNFRDITHNKKRNDPDSNTIIIGFGPNGAVSVWVSSIGNSVEVVNYKALEVNRDWKSVTENDEMSRSEYIDMVLKDSLTPSQLRHLKEHGVPPQISDYYSKQHRWNLQAIGQKNRELWLKTLNGEEEYFDFVKTANTRTSRGLPKSLVMYWENNVGQKLGADVRFDEAEINAAYKKLSAEKTDHPMQLKMEISDNPEVIHTSLNDGKYVILLSKTVVKAYSRR